MGCTVDGYGVCVSLKNLSILLIVLMILGLITVPAGGGGTFLGGYLVKKLNLSCRGIIKFCLIATIFAAAFTICFFLSCPNLIFAGVTAPYFPFKSSSEYQKNLPISGDISHEEFLNNVQKAILENRCNNECSCNNKKYEPICGADGVMYYSPCHAGCKEELNLDTMKVYRNCACIDTNNMTIEESSIKGDFDAINTMCESKCPHLWLFSVMCFCVMFFTFLATMPALSATLRYVFLILFFFLFYLLNISLTRIGVYMMTKDLSHLEYNG